MEFDQVFDSGKNLLADEDLSRLCLLAQAGRMIGHGTDNRIVGPLVEADPSNGCMATGNADPEAKVVTSFEPLLRMLIDGIPHRHTHGDCLLGVIFSGQRVVENHDHSVADEPF